jgi:hypothetical protein
MGKASFLGIRHVYKEVRMSKNVEATALVPMARTGVAKTLREVARESLPANPEPRHQVEVVSDEDARFEKALARRVQSPTDFIKEASRVQPPLTRGALVSVETLLGFLVAMEEILPPESNYPILTSVKVWFDPADHPRLFVEGGSHSVWTIVAIEAEAYVKNGFHALLPVHRAKNVLATTSSAQKKIMVGVDNKGFCLGAHAVPFGGMIADFPSQPVLVDPIARAVIPAFYYQEIVDRVMPARSLSGLEKLGAQGVLLDFDVAELDGTQVPVCIAVATDGNRMHILYLPRVMLESKVSRMPPAVRVAAGFFRYMKAIVNHEWAGLEFSAKHLVAKGKDFIVVAGVALEPRAEPSELGAWRKVNISYQGSWLIDSSVLEDGLAAAPGKYVRLRIDSFYDELVLSSEAEDGTRYRKKLPAKRSGGAPYVDVLIGKTYLLDAVKACSSKLVRLGFEKDKKRQPSAPVVVQGEDEQFKAIVMPMVEG